MSAGGTDELFNFPVKLQDDPTSLGSWVWFILPASAWADGELAEVVEQMGKMIEHTHPKKPNPIQDVVAL